MNPVSQDHDSDQDSDNSKCFCNKYNSDTSRRRRLVVAFDGTQNQFGPESSHVVEFYSRIVKSGDQFSYYTSGVGSFVKPSSSMRRKRMWIKNKWAAALGLNFKSNLLSGYRFLSDKYEKGDQIFLLGFSRGAYQARVLAAMITKVGLLRTGNNEQIPFAFNMYTDPEASVDEPIDTNNPGGEQTNTANEFKKAFCYDVNIHFVGVWDTVSSVGVFRNKYYPGAELADNICFFRHALALDERRVKFIPEYIFAEKEFFSVGEFGPPRCKEVWFRGCHSDIGGGNVKNRTSDNGAIPSRWMAYEAMLAGLEMTPFRGGITVTNLEPKDRKESMTRLYSFLENVPFIKWEGHSADRPPTLEFNTSSQTPLRTSKEPRTADDFSRACHHKRPRQIYDHQKLHSSVCLHNGSSANTGPFARLPNSWTHGPGWTNILDLLRRKEENIKATKSTFDNRDEILQGHPPTPEINAETRAMPTLSAPPLALDPTIVPPDVQDVRAMIGQEPAVADVLPPEAIELDLLDCDVIPTLIAGVRRGTNVKEFLERLGVLACTGNGMAKIRANNQFSSMLQTVYSDERWAEYAELAIRVAYQVFWHSEVDLYASDNKLWEAILSCTNRSMDSSSLHMAGRLVHKAKSDEAVFPIKDTTIKIFNQWQRTFTEHSPAALVQLRFLLTTAMERKLNVEGYVLRLSVLASPYISDAGFKGTLLKRLVNAIIVSGRETRKRAMLCLCILCATDDVTLDTNSFNQLKGKFVRVEPMREMWELVMPETSDSLRGRETTPKLKNLLQLDRIKNALSEDDHSWALLTLDKALDRQITLRFDSLLELAQVA